MPGSHDLAACALALLLGAGCLSAKPGTDVPPAPPYRGAFVSAVVFGQRDGVVLRAQLSWHGAVRGSKGGITLDASLR